VSGRHRRLPVRSLRREAYGWTGLYGPAGGLTAAACQDAHAHGRSGWAAAFAVLTAATAPVYFGLLWRDLR
jgi:hypothetical protein